VTPLGVSVAGKTPVPDSDTIWGLLEALSVMVSVPVSLPNTVGVKVTLTLHVLPIASEDPHVFAEIAKLPLVAMPLMDSRYVPLFFNVAVLAVLVSLRA